MADLDRVSVSAVEAARQSSGLAGNIEQQAVSEFELEKMKKGVGEENDEKGIRGFLQNLAEGSK